MHEDSLVIPNPCPVKWSEMTPQEGGRFCSICEKKVHDFKGWKKEDVINLIEASDERICGRINRNLLLGETLAEKCASHKGKRYRWLAIAGSVVMFVISSCKNIVLPPPLPGGDMIKVRRSFLYDCTDKDTKTLDYLHKPNIHEDRFKDIPMDSALKIIEKEKDELKK